MAYVNVPNGLSKIKTKLVFNLTKRQLICALPFQLSFVNHRSRPENRYSVNIPMRQDENDSIRGEFVDMLENQIARSNNGILRSKYITFGISADGIGTARPRLERVEAGRSLSLTGA